MADSPKVPWKDKPGKSNWVEKTGALKPKGSNWIRRTAEHLKGKGMPTGQAIATAVNAAKKMCATGKTNLPGAGQVNAVSKAEACAAVAKWEAGKAKTKAKAVAEGVADEELRVDALALVPEELREAVSLTREDKLELKKGQTVPSMLIEGLTLLGVEEGREPVEALREAVADVRRWAFGINEDREDVPGSLQREATAALEPWDRAKQRAHSELIQEGTHAGHEHISDEDYLEMLEAKISADDWRLFAE